MSVSENGGQPERVAYRRAGRAQRAAFARATKHRLTDADHQIFHAVLHETTSYSRVSAQVTVGRLAELAGIHPKAAARSIRKLAKLGVVTWQPGRGRHDRSVVGVPEEPDSKGAAVVPFEESRQEVKGSSSGVSKGAAVVPFESSPTPPSKNEKKEREESKRAAARAYECAEARPHARGAALPAAAQISTEEETTDMPGPIYPDSYPAELEGDNVADDGDGHENENRRPGTDVPAEVATKLAALGAVNPGTVALVAEQHERYPQAVGGLIEKAATKRRPGAYLHGALTDALARDELPELEQAADANPSEQRCTGIRMQRGEGGVSYVLDPQGVDVLPRGHEPPKPRTENRHLQLVDTATDEEPAPTMTLSEFKRLNDNEHQDADEDPTTQSPVATT